MCMYVFNLQFLAAVVKYFVTPELATLQAKPARPDEGKDG